MMTRSMPDVPDSSDELDLLSSSTPTLVGSASTSTTPTRDSSPAPKTRNNTARKVILRYASALRSKPTSAPKAIPNTTTVPKPRSRKRKAADDDDTDVENSGLTVKVVKKAKKDEKKAATIVINSKRVAVEAARKRWLYRHKALFTPLLPQSSNYFATLVDEIAYSVDKGTYVAQTPIKEQPSLVVGGQMKDYQLQGLSYLVWMYNNGMNCILGDEMGLGKTLQTLSLFAHIQENAKGHVDPHLVICPLSVVETWLKESHRWNPTMRTLRFHAQQAERDRIKTAVRDGKLSFDLCVTTYEAYVAEDGWFKSRRWTYVVLDEGHRIKNSETMLAGKLQGLGSLYKLILTGTPVQNNLVELWGLLHWLYPAIFTATTQRLFQSSFDLTKGTYDTPFLSAAEKLLGTIMLRRTKDMVEGEVKVPKREELTVFVPMSEAQRFWTYRMLMRLDTRELEEIFVAPLEKGKGKGEAEKYIQQKLRESKTGQHNQWKRLMNLLMQLRQVCDHPYLLPDAEPTPYTLGEHIVASSSKLTVVDKILKDLLPKGERVLIFSQWTNMLDLLEDFMALRKIPYARLDGSTPRPRRTLDIKLFQQEKSPYQVFLISTKAGGLGINLTKASTVIMFDSEWNPQNDLQAIARAHRIGQTKTVKVYRLICEGSVEDQMLDRLRRKLFLSLKIMGGHHSASSSDSNADADNEQALKKKELMDILRRGSSALSRTGGMSLAEFLDAPVEEVLKASRTRDESRSAKLQKEVGVKGEEGEDAQTQEKLKLDADEEEKQLLSGVAQVQSRLFEGKVVQRAKEGDSSQSIGKKSSYKDVADEWHALQKRARHSRIVTVDGYEVLAELLGPSEDAPKPVQQPKRTRKFDSEDWCIYCRDGGDLVVCNHCPRVFHARCHGLTKKAVKQWKGPMLCPQHRCTECGRSTGDCGGMLFRCQTCPRALCEDCLPQGDIDAVGDTLPEFLLRDYGATATAYYIRCSECHERFEKEPAYWKQWQEEMRETEAKLAALEE